MLSKVLDYKTLGAMQLHLEMKSQVLSVWYRMVNGTKDKICNKLYHVMYYLHANDLFHSDWVKQYMIH